MLSKMSIFDKERTRENVMNIMWVRSNERVLTENVNICANVIMSKVKNV